MDFQSFSTYLCHLVFCSVQIVWAVDELTLLNPPQELHPDHRLKVLYSCDKPATVLLDCDVTFDNGMTSAVLLGNWTCIPADPKIRIVQLKLPDWLVYQADGIVPESGGVLSCILRASLRYSRVNDDTERTVAAQAVAPVEPKAFFDRPVKQHELCFAWSLEMLRLSSQFLRRQCPVEKETVHFLSSIYASTGENIGITKTLRPYGSDVLEYLRLKAITYPWCSMSIWIFVTRLCQDTMCGILHHIDSRDEYVSPAVLLTKSGKLHVQMNGRPDESTAFLTTYTVPLRQWCQLSVTLQGKTVIASMVCVDGEERTAQSVDYVLGFTPKLDDTQGYFVIGGGKYIRGVEGYFGPVVYHRNRISAHGSPVIPDVIRDVNLTGWLQACQTFQLETEMKIRGYSLRAQQGKQPDTCSDALHKWVMKERRVSNSQCELWEATVPRRRQAAKLIQLYAFKYGGKGVSLAAVGRALYALSLHKLSRVSSTGMVSRILPLLLQSGCLADNRALHMSSTFLSAGFGVEQQLKKAWLLALLAAQKDDRLALFHLGHVHHQGLDGLSKDTDLAFAYYGNIGLQTATDHQNHSSEQTFVEAIYLNNEEVLKHQTNEKHHLFQWLKLEARRGATEAEQAVARMLFWGQQGVAPDIEKAVRHYQRGAIRLEDPQSMYDYGIVLLQGRGIEKDIPQAVIFLKKAADKGFVPAINGLGWYYETFERDYVKAVHLWEQADLLGSPDAAFNLGVMYSQGRYPGKVADQYMAHKFYVKAAERGHIRGTVLVANTWTTGLPGFVNRRPLDAVLWMKWAAEHNGYLGTVLRKGLDSYLKGDMFGSLFYYMMAAETGYAPAQFNVAYLCEQNMGRFLDPVFASRCMRKYYNLTIQSPQPVTYALIKMGDLHYEGQVVGQKDLFSAAELYKEAALRNEPQGWYNLGLLAEEGYRLPLSLLTALGLSELFLSDQTQILSALYNRCRNSEDTDSYLPCSLALFNVYFQLFQNEYSAVIKLSIAVAVAAAPIVLFILPGLMRRRDPSRIQP